VGCSYETISRDFSQTNYSSSRLSLLEDRDHWRILQNWLVENLHQRVFDVWLDMAVLSGALPLPNYEIQAERYKAVRWMPRGWAWVDPAKEVEAYAMAVRNGFKTLSEVVAEQGGDIEELMQGRRQELDVAADLDLKFDTDPGSDPAPAAPAPAAAAPADDNDEDNPDNTDGSIA
jgi:lambda family phage portal protein